MTDDEKQRLRDVQNQLWERIKKMREDEYKRVQERREEADRYKAELEKRLNEARDAERDN